MGKNKLSIFEKKQTEIDNTQADILSLRNTLQAVAQMRKLQREAADPKRQDPDRTRLESAVDMRLASLGIKAI